MKHYSEFKINDFNFKTIPRDKRKKVDYDKECDNIFCFDIEVTSAWVTNDGDVIGYIPGLSDNFWNSQTPVALPYIWQLSVDSTVYYGRDLSEFKTFIDNFSKDTHFIIYVHNLAYEFVFLSNFFEPWNRVFARQPHKVMNCFYNNIEFRCSYFLTRLSLESWGKELNFDKLHTLDYYKLRTPLTPLNNDELSYCERDCAVMYKGLLNYLKKYGHIYSIPLTQTGEVRRVVKKIMRTDSKTGKTDNKKIRKMISLLPENAYMYMALKKAFAGGSTHANYLYSGDILYNLWSYDFASSYPAVMCSERFPMTKFIPDDFNDSKTDVYAYLIKVKFSGVTQKTANHYMSRHKCLTINDKKPTEKTSAEYDNGRIMNCDEFTAWITEQDYSIIKRTYNIKKTEILECYSARKTYLPKDFISYTLSLYNDKTKLKNITGKEDVYLQSKQFINSLFGMCVTDIIQDEVAYLNGNGEWEVKELSFDMLNDKLEDLKMNNKGKTFLNYAWGVWVTAYARKNLWDCLIPNDLSVVYYDTDSLKVTEQINFTWYNNRIDNKLMTMCRHYGLDFNLTRPCDSKGVPHPLGHFEIDEKYTEFKTLGAKKYVGRSERDGELHLTVSGINKSAVGCLNNDIKNFNENFVFDKDAPDVHKLLSTYITDGGTVVFNKGKKDEWVSDLKYAVNMRPIGYSLSITDEYAYLIYLNNKSTLRCLED